jgi:hypothetical protein
MMAAVDGSEEDTRGQLSAYATKKLMHSPYCNIRKNPAAASVPLR